MAERLIAALVLFPVCFLFWGFWIEPASLVVNETRIRLPAETGFSVPLRIAVLADLHVGSPHNGLEKLARIVAETNRLNPDIILLPGDFVVEGVLFGGFVPPEELTPVLARLKAPLGVWAVLGNHDWWLDPLRVRRALEAAGISVIDDQARRVVNGRLDFWLVGFSDFQEGTRAGSKALEAVSSEKLILAMTHNPDLFPHLSDRISLLIAGHTHGGQVALPRLGRPVVPSIYGERYAIGSIVEDGRRLFVSPGLGTSILGLRFRVPPEISLLTLVPELPETRLE